MQKMQTKNKGNLEIRKSAVEGMFYPSDADELNEMIDKFLKNAKETKIDGETKAIIVPHAGYFYSGQTAAYAYKLLEKFKGKKKIILLGPSHQFYFEGIAADVNEYWQTPLGKVKVIASEFDKLENAHAEEHCLEVQIPFLQKVLKEFEILPLVLCETDPKDVAEKIIPLLDKDTLIVISSDLSHYHPYDEAVRLDKATNEAVEKLDYHSAESKEACGIIPILTAIEIAKKLKWKCRLLKYMNSGDVMGDRGNVVGYSSFVMYK
jgi:AmmeMemoRadiSam system protein B